MTAIDIPQREAGPEGAEPGVKIPQPHRSAGPQRGGQIHPDEAAGGRPPAFQEEGVKGIQSYNH